MTQEDKDLLLKDLCTRLPYGVKVICGTERSIFEVEAITSYSCVCPKDKNYLHNIDDDEIKPCLFPLSSMTEEQKREYRKVCELDTEILEKHPMDASPFPAMYNSQDWLDAHHFDYRGLIPMGLAIDATGLNIY